MQNFDYGELALLVGQLGDVEATRIAMENRYRNVIDTDTPGRGRSVDDRQLVKPLRDLNAEIIAMETAMIRLLEKYMRNGPWGPWLASEYSRGVGAKQLARLLGAIGDPYWHKVEDRPRMVGELWAYSGFHVTDEGIAPRRQRGVRSNWSEVARTRAHLIAESCIKQRKGQYRAVYDRIRTHYDDAVHAKDCIRCGPSGNPAKAGSPLSLGHQHARALRAVSKEVLRDLWIYARGTIHAVPEGTNEFGDMKIVTSGP